MAEINYFEIIQNKLDALVDKIIRKENSDEDFRITYAQILEKINTKMDIFSNNNTEQRLDMIYGELINLIRERQDIVDAKFNAVKGEFDHLNNLLENSLKTSDLVSAFNQIQNQIKNFSEEQENQKFAFNSIVSHIEKFGTLEETNESLNSHFSIIKEQNTVINDNVNKQLEVISILNSAVEENNKKAFEQINLVVSNINELAVKIEEETTKLDDAILSGFNSKVDEIVLQLNEMDSALSILNCNMDSLLKTVESGTSQNNLDEMKHQISETLAKTIVISDSIKQIATKDELIENSNNNKEELKKYNQDLITELEQKLLSNLDFSALDDIKRYTEKMFFQGTEVLKDEMWTIKDSFNEFNQNSLRKDYFDTKVDELKAVSAEIKDIATTVKTDLTDIISEESVAASNQLTEVSATIQDLKNSISDIVLNQQNEQITTALQNLQSKFVTQLVQIADNISFSEDADEIQDNIISCTEELKDKISTDIADIKNDITSLRGFIDLNDEKIVDILNKIDISIHSDISGDLKTVISSLRLLTTGLLDSKDHIYTMPDIETDLSKIRLELDKIQKSLIATDSQDGEDINSKLNLINKAITELQESNFDKDVSDIKSVFNSINEDIASISKRTNRLILASDEVSKTLKSNISAFSVLIGSFERQSREFYNSSFILDLNEKIENLGKMSSSLLQSDQAMNEAFMYIGEWIDTTSDTFDELQADIIKIKKSLLYEDIDSSCSPSAIAQKLEMQDRKIASIDERINDISEKLQDTKEIKTMMEFIVSQVSMTNEKVANNDELLQKINSMEKQIKKIENNVSAITEYLDED